MNDKKEVYINAGLLLISYIATILVIFLSSYIQYGYQLSIGDISPRNFTATHQIENRLATELLREEARNSIPIIISRDEEVGINAIYNLNIFFDTIEQYKNDLEEREYEKEQLQIKLENEIQMVIDEHYLEYGEILDIEVPLASYYIEEVPIPYISFLSEASISILASITYEEFDFFRQRIENELLRFFEGEVSENTSITLSEAQALIPSQSFTFYQIILSIFSYFLEPNINEENLEQFREDAVNAVEPVMFLQGQLIVGYAQLITEEIYTILVDLNYISDGYTVNFIPLIGVALIVFILFIMCTFYIYLFYPFLNKNRTHRMLLFTLYIILIGTTLFLATAPFVFMPVLIFTMLVGILLRYKLAIVLNIAATIITMLATDYGLSFVIYYLITGTIVAIFTKYILQRSKLIVFSFLISLISAAVAFSVLILVERTITNETFLLTGFSAITGFFVVIICMGTLPLWESFFGVTTQIKLLEYTNPSNELLRRLSIEASGTYHHSIIVANLAEAAAYEIGADAVAVRVGAYFHDIGKLHAPKYFVENQLGHNYHDYIDAKTSAEIIKNHVTHGLELAKEHKLPSIIRDIIAEHHGTSLIKYFYFKAKKLDENINEDEFKYSGEIPKSRESAIVMLADTIEAAVRSQITTNNKTKEEIPEFITQLVNDKVLEGQLLNSELTFGDIEKIKEVFLRVLNGMYHDRISYPKAEKDEEK